MDAPRHAASRSRGGAGRAVAHLRLPAARPAAAPGLRLARAPAAPHFRHKQLPGLQRAPPRAVPAARRRRGAPPRAAAPAPRGAAPAAVETTRRPRFVAPHQPRLDWQMWFAALDPDGARGWLLPFVARLLQGSPEVVSLLAENPFPEGPPRYVRLAYYRYRFSTPAERARTGAWWDRVFAGYLTRPLSLADLVPPR